ncbi:Mnt [Sphingobium yanoikuyae]|uniref:Mnt n=1 Tax=Sphingobium yanoikuyae TaxID=13690 RepID=A0A084EGS1_SPHYA|nr:Arc family DNA-binding protein [Sphingobium yanoikuyae]KEZ17163.1 Mnt [Sphingobium yanoikuyae]
MSRQIPPFGLRMPDKLRVQLKELAETRRRSMNAQIIVMLESGMAAEKAASGQPS